MKYLKRYDEVVCIISLSTEDQATYNYIIGEGSINEASFGNIIDRLKRMAQKGAISATLMVSLFSNPAFSREYDALPDSEKTEIQSMVRGGTPSIQIQSSSLSINLKDFFESGEHQMKESQKAMMDMEIQKLKDFVEANKDEKLVITILASESRVPVKGKDGKYLKEKELAQKRFEWTKKILQERLGDRIEIVGDVVVGGPEYKGDDAGLKKYKDHQYVKVSIGLDLWNLNKKELGKQATKADDYIGKKYEFQVAGREGEGSVKLIPGRIPDRAKVFIDGVLAADSGYFADKPSEKGYKQTPAYVMELTKGLEESPNTNAFKGIRSKKVTSVAELDSLILENGFDPEKSGNNRGEYEYSYKLLKKYVESRIKSKGYAVIGLYSSASNPMHINIEGNSNVKIEVYSPVGNTGFEVSVDMKSSKKSYDLANL